MTEPSSTPVGGSSTTTVRCIPKTQCLLAVLAAMLACATPPSYRGERVQPTTAPLLRGVNWDGQNFDLADLRGRVVLVFFGYTYCPDVCPLTLAKMQQLEERLGDRSGDLAVVFASVDPHRDSVEKLAQYVPAFDRRFYGVHLDDDQLADATDAFGLTVQIGQPKDGPGTDSYYYVDHTGSYFLLGRQGQLRLKHPPNARVDDLFPDVEALLEEPAA